MHMNSDNSLQQIIKEFAPIQLEKMDKVKLMRRMDTKFVFNISLLPELLKKARERYFMVEIMAEREQIYKTVYFDTEDYKMYHLHHNGKRKRHKVRVRNYIYTNQQFLEIKQKNNKGETIKKRVNYLSTDNMTTGKTNDFLNQHIPFNPNLLQETLANKFIRITLVNKDFTERITLDYNLKFTDLKTKQTGKPENICIAEIKKSRDDKQSPFIKYLRELRVCPTGFSKYCMGLAMLNPDIKSNRFKEKIRTIDNF